LSCQINSLGQRFSIASPSEVFTKIAGTGILQMTQQDRKAIRESIRRQRLEIADEVRQIASQRICRTMAQLHSFQEARKVAGFLAFEGEAEPLELMTLAYQQQKSVYVPIIVAKGEPLKFAPWHPRIPMKRNFFGIEEPDVSEEEWIVADELDFVICPLVAFDQWCHRIGVGAGYYDRTFAFLVGSTSERSRSSSHPTILAGFAFEIQHVTRIETAPWDVNLDWVVTEKQIYRRLN
jgi:5-formyltetrahydrofolate cyclo-ligase